MRIGEYFVKKKYITQETLDEALRLQKSCKGQRIGDILVNMGEISKGNLIKYVSNYIDDSVRHTGSWLKQEDIDKLFDKS